MEEDEFIQKIRKLNEQITSIFDAIDKTIDKMMSSAFNTVNRLASFTNYEIYDLGDKIKVIVELPGVEKEDIKVRQLDDRTIAVSAHSDMRNYNVKITLPASVKNVVATYKNGLLTITGDKIKEEEEGKEIPIF